MTAQESILQNAYETTLALAIGADLAETSVQVNAAPVGSPSASNPMYLVIDPDSDSTREYIKVTSRSGVSLTVVRNIDTDSGGLNAHAVGAKVRMVAMKQHFEDINDRVDTIMNSAGTAVNTSGLVKDEDTMSSNSDTHLATQQSIKAYVDNQVTAQDLDFTADTTTGTPSIDLDSETLNVAGGAGIETSASGNEITVAIDSTVVTESSTDTLTNKTIDANATGNSITNIEVADLASGVLDTDLSTVSASDDTLPSAKAVKTYVDDQVDTKDTLAELDDVTITTPGEDEVLAYDNGTSKFINQTPSEAGLATDTDLTSHTGNTSNPHSVTAAQTGATTTSNKITDFTAPTSDLDMNSNKITNVTDPTAAQDAATKSYVDAQVDTADTLAELNDVTITTPGEDEVLAYDSGTSQFINQTPSEAGLATSAQGALADSATQPSDNISTLTNDSGFITASTTDTLTNKTIDADGTGNSITNIEDANIKAAAAIDAAKIADGSVSNTEFQHLNGVTSAIQTQIDAKGSGDITAVNTAANSGLAGGATTGDASITVDPSNLTDGSGITVDTANDLMILEDVTDGTVYKVNPSQFSSGSAGALTDGDSDFTLTDGVANGIHYELDNTDMADWNQGGVALTAAGGVFQHNQTQSATYTIGSGSGTVLAGPITITGTITNSGTMVIL